MCCKAKNASIGQAEVILVGVPLLGIVAAVIALPYPSLSRVVMYPDGCKVKSVLAI